MGNAAKSVQREFASFTPLLNAFGFDIKAVPKILHKKNLPININSFHLYQMNANYYSYNYQYAAY
jgi:hypothetical protein